jgi:hypothetical protein
MDALAEGSVLLMSDGAFVFQRIEYNPGRAGNRMILRDVDGSVTRSIRYLPNGWVTRLELPVEVAEGEGFWMIQPGDIIWYPAHSVVAIRHVSGWMRTAAPWTPCSDAEVILHLGEGRIEVLRSSLRQTGTKPRKTYPVGSVVACRVLKAPEPTVWVKTDESCWVSNVRGTTASDLMINYELSRRTYHVVRVPQETGK